MRHQYALGGTGAFPAGTVQHAPHKNATMQHSAQSQRLRESLGKDGVTGRGDNQEGSTREDSNNGEPCWLRQRATRQPHGSEGDPALLQLKGHKEPRGHWHSQGALLIPLEAAVL